jgi:hypothetical protein
MASSRTDTAANADLGLRAERAPRAAGLVQVAPVAELPDVRSKAGAQAGMAIAVVAGGAFWAVVGAAALFFLRH